MGICPGQSLGFEGGMVHVSGYLELRTQSMGISIQEWLESLDADESTELKPLAQGVIHTVHHRSLILRPEGRNAATPEFVIVGLSSLEQGPLFIALPSDTALSFVAQGLQSGQSFCLYRRPSHASPSGSSVASYRLHIGLTLDLQIDSVFPDAASVFERTNVPQQLGPSTHLDQAWAVLREGDFSDGLQWLAAPRPRPDLSGTPGYALLIEIRNALKVEEVADPVLETTRWLLGRGPGSTPSGDDILSGLLLVLYHSLPVALQANYHRISDSIIKTARSRTTDLSVAFLIQAQKGRAADSLLEYMQRVLFAMGCASPRDIPGLVTQISAMGHTSGIDTLMGMLLGWRLSLIEDGCQGLPDHPGPRFCSRL